MTPEPELVKETPPFRMVGDAGGSACAGEVCEVPAPAGPLPDGASRD
jgi:hypothetical protein